MQLLQPTHNTKRLIAFELELIPYSSFFFYLIQSSINIGKTACRNVSLIKYAPLRSSSHHRQQRQQQPLASCNVQTYIYLHVADRRVVHHDFPYIIIDRKNFFACISVSIGSVHSPHTSQIQGKSRGIITNGMVIHKTVYFFRQKLKLKMNRAGLGNSDDILSERFVRIIQMRKTLPYSGEKLCNEYTKTRTDIS